MATAFKLPTAATPVERILSRFDRQQIESFIEIAIGLLDVANDPDMEEDDPPEQDDDSGQRDEDGINTGFDMVRYTPGSTGAGCPISDPGGGNSEDEGEEINEAEPMAPLTLNPDRDSWLD